MTLIERPDKYPEWASEDHTDPVKPVPNVVDPPLEKKKKGWFYEETPPANWFNWLLRYAYRWVHFFDDQRTNSNPVFAIDTSGTPNQIVVALTPPSTEFVPGRLYMIKVANTITGASTLQVDSLPAKQIVDLDELDLVGGEMLINMVYMIIYDAALDKFILQSKNTSDFKTGDVLISSQTAARPGFITYTNDGTIGNASSGASIFANDAAKNLFLYWWAAFTYLNVLPSRGASALEDWNANKQLQVYPYYNRVFAAANTEGALVNPCGKTDGETRHSLNEFENGWHVHGTTFRNENVSPHAGGSLNLTWFGDKGVSTAGSGAGEPHNTLQPTIYMTVYVKL